MPLTRWMRGEYRVPMEKYCRGKGVALFDVEIAWSLTEDAAAANAAGWWRAATGEPPPDDQREATHAELVDPEGLQRLRTLAASGPDGDAAFPHLLASPPGGGVVYLPAPVARIVVIARGGDECPMAVASSVALFAELESLSGRLGPVRDWGEVGEGEFAAAHDDPRFAEQTAWSILRFLARESERRGLPLILPPVEDGP